VLETALITTALLIDAHALMTALLKTTLEP
jgi:hypothetical protein